MHMSNKTVMSLILVGLGGCTTELPERIGAEACALADRCGIALDVDDPDGCEAQLEDALSCTGSLDQQRACARDLQLATCDRESPWPASCASACELPSVAPPPVLAGDGPCGPWTDLEYPPTPAGHVCVAADGTCAVEPACDGRVLLTVDLVGGTVRPGDGLSITAIPSHPGHPTSDVVVLGDESAFVDLILGTADSPVVLDFTMIHDPLEDGTLRVSAYVRSLASDLVAP